MIHKTFSKLDLKDFISDLNINIPYYEALNKHQLVKALNIYLNNDNQYDFINSVIFKDKDLEYLKIYLSLPNPNKLLSVKERNEILKICKEIIHYCNTGFCIENTIFSDVNQLIDNLDYVKQYGDIPSVRRSCKLIKGDIKMNRDFIPIISDKVKRDLELKKQNKIKNKKINNLIVKYGVYKVIFD